MKLILVESPTKARTLSKFLGKDYQIEATMGHIRDLPKSSLGVDLENDFTPSYVIPRDKSKRVKELVALAKKAEVIILASDPDREGEAIAWHIAAILTDSKNQKSKIKSFSFAKTSADKQKEKTKKNKKVNPNFQRITFHEITETAIHDAIKNPGEINHKLVDAQQARRILDRLVGYKLSPLLWRKLSRKWLSAGRVQSVAVRLIVEREREIEVFQKSPFFTIEADFQSDKKSSLTANLVSKDGKKYEESTTLDLFDGKYTTSNTTISDEEKAKAIIHDFGKPFRVHGVDKKEIKRNPPAPFTTSTLQQDAGRRLYFSAKKTMQVAQKLYEEGCITYHRTDSVNLSEKFVAEAREYIGREYGVNYVPESVRVFQTKSKLAQEAHEAIRPTEARCSPAELPSSEGFNHDHIRLYELIWKRSLASQAKEAIFDSTNIEIQCGNGYMFEAKGSVVKFDGYLKIAGKETDETIVPKLLEGETINLTEARSVSHETLPPPRYSESSLIKTLEEKDIGRPSTYAPTISTIIERQYVKKEEKRLFPTELGILVNDFLVEYFPEVMSLPFTAKMEARLDAIANGDVAWVPVVKEFYDPFSERLNHSFMSAETIKLSVEELDEKCPDCGNGLVLRTGRYGKFVACSNFPACKYTRQYGEKIDKVCPTCGSVIVIKRSKRGKTFYGCSNYPKCTFAAWKKEDIK